MARVLILLSVLMLSIYMTEQASFLKEEYINKINKEAKSWKAGMNFDPNTPKEQILRLLGSKSGELSFKPNPNEYKSVQYIEDENLFGRIPRNFDARKKWRQCSTIGRVRDQGNCGSCWALATSSAFADRLCVATHGQFNRLLSAEELAFCCYSCGDGCDGGYPLNAWKFFRENGLVSGGDYNTTDGCEPYNVKPCTIDDKGENSCAGEPLEDNHRCTRTCYGQIEIDYESDHKFTRDFYYLKYNGIQKDVLIFGPIEASFAVYDDFVSYKSGVYVKSENATYLGGHAVKLIGWGVEHGVPYWLMVNSWNTQWGDKGLFKIRRGTNECGIEDRPTAGVPIVD